MASVSHVLVRVKEQSGRLLSDGQIEQTAREQGHSWRRRLLGPAQTVQLFLMQLLARVAMMGLRHVAGVAVTAQAICEAKMRLPLGVLLALVEKVSQGLLAGADDQADTFHDHRVVMADGMSFMTADTSELAGHFGKGSNQRGQSHGYPVPKLLALVDRGTGLIRKVIGLPHARQEQSVLSQMFSLLAPGDLLLGDRGLVSFAHLALTMMGGFFALMRLPEGQALFGGGRGRVRNGKSKRRRGRGKGRILRRMGKQDLLVRWDKPDQKPRWMSKADFLKLPAHLMLRQIAFRTHRRGFRTQWARVITTLLDPGKYPARELAELYGRRWQIEVCFRDLKKTLGMGQVLRAKTVEGVKKEVACFVLLYNLVRQVMLEAARRQGVAPDRISFIDAALWLLWSAPGAGLPTLQVNPKRRRKTQPRKLKRGRKKYPPLRGDRHAQCLPPAEVKL